MFVIGITGGIGTGKSTVASLCREAGLAVLDADKISHSVTQSDGFAIPEIAERFGQEYINTDGSLNRAKMSDLVFENKKALDALSFIVHKHTMKQMAVYLDNLENSGEKVVVLDVPIPVKEGFLDRCDQVWNVTSDQDIRLNRLEKRGLSRTEALRRMAVQMTPEEYSKIANIDIFNNHNFDQLREQVNKILASELGSRGLPFNKI
ncbi:MAG TPA: dephospho-CoA kinase [Clostridiaceae bacterium]|nr:dephospho-CoA kinase [Clostridiaceae bacterium]